MVELGPEKRGKKLSQNGLDLSTKTKKTVTKRTVFVDSGPLKLSFVSIDTGI